jgi:ferrochelatase
VTATPQQGVLLMSYGTPGRAEEVEAYYTHIRRGRPPTDEQLADLQRRYEAIGGLSPLTERTRAQAAGVQSALDVTAPDTYRVVVGSKHAAPFIEDAVADLVQAGVTRAVGIVLAPHDSELSVGEYAERAGKAAGGDVDLRFVRSWHLEPELIELLADRVRVALEGLSSPTEVLFTAHSLPARIVESGDPYPGQVAATGEAVAAAVALDRWRVAWQSAGRTPEPWIGPDILEVIRSLAGSDARSVLVCPVGFTSDHLEVLYDVDIEAARVAGEVGLRLGRTASLNDDPKFCALLARLARTALE